MDCPVCGSNKFITIVNLFHPEQSMCSRCLQWSDWGSPIPAGADPVWQPYHDAAGPCLVLGNLVKPIHFTMYGFGSLGIVALSADCKKGLTCRNFFPYW